HRGNGWALHTDRDGELPVRTDHDDRRPARRRRRLARALWARRSRSGIDPGRVDQRQRIVPGRGVIHRRSRAVGDAGLSVIRLRRRSRAGGRARCERGMNGVPVVALIGRPNVGKSALFNRIVGDDSAIVSDEAGTTRDRHFAQADWAGRAFWLVDTGGVADDPRAPMDREIRRQVDEAIGEADLLLFVVDARVGLHPSDHHVAELLRNSRKPWMLVANKVDDPKTTDFYEFYTLGVADVFPVSAINGKGSGDLLDAMVARLPQAEPEAEQAMRVAVVGRPNVGKSSFVNRLLGEERLVVSEIAGTTRDAIDTPLRYHGRTFIFVDTAGLRRQSRI